MGPAGADLPAGLLALRHDIATAEHSITANRWLTKQPAVSVPADLAARRMPLTHEAFDKLPKRPILEHLRLTLVAVGALPERDEELVRLEHALTDFLAAQQDPNRRKILHRYLIWNLLRPESTDSGDMIEMHRRRSMGCVVFRWVGMLVSRVAPGSLVSMEWVGAGGAWWSGPDGQPA
jgi:hypothetical protein